MKRNAKITQLNTSELPQLPQHWAWVRLEELSANEVNAITDGPFGSKLKTEHYTASGPRVIRLQNIGNGDFRDEYAHISHNHFSTLTRHQVHGGDLVIAALGADLPRSCVVPESLGPAIVKADCIRFKPCDQLVSCSFLNFSLNSQVIRRIARNIIHGVGRPRLNLSEIKSLWVPVAPLNEQRRIVDKIEELFSDLDAGVAALERVQKALKRYRASVLKAAVEGRLTAEWRAQHPDVEPASQLLQRILAERRRKWETEQLAKYQAAGKQPPTDWQAKYKQPAGPNTDDLTELPDGWCWANTAQIAEIQGGIQKQPKRRPKENAYPFLRVANVYRSQLDLSQVNQIELFGGELRRLKLQPGDLLVVEGNGSKTEIGRCAIWSGEIENCVHQNHLIRVRLIAGDAKYIDAYWNSPLGSRKVVTVAASSSGLYTLSITKISAIPIPLPPEDEQIEIVREIEERTSVVDTVEAQLSANLKRAARLRQSILKRAFEGKLVPQDPNDEPASVLLERIKQERTENAARTNAASNGQRRKRRRSGGP